MITFEKTKSILGEDRVREIITDKIVLFSELLDDAENELYIWQKKGSTCKNCDDILYEIKIEWIEEYNELIESVCGG